MDIVVGKGEVGSPIGQIIEDAGRSVLYHDPGKGMYAAPVGEVDVLNICFPYSEKFVDECKNYIRAFKPKLTIIHSTVPVGTTRAIGDDVVFSFVRGRHSDDMKEAMKVHTKHLGSVSEKSLNRATAYLVELGFEPDPYIVPEAVELGKLFDTSYYGVTIAWTKYMADVCDELGVPWEAIAEMNRAYNRGALLLGHNEWVRPELEPMAGPIGGHCVVPNAKILMEKFPHKLLEAIIEANCSEFTKNSVGCWEAK